MVILIGLTVVTVVVKVTNTPRNNAVVLGIQTKIILLQDLKDFFLSHAKCVWIEFSYIILNYVNAGDGNRWEKGSEYSNISAFTASHQFKRNGKWIRYITKI